MVDGARPSRRATARSGSPTDSPRLISSRSASDRRDWPGDHTSWLDSRLPRARTTNFTVEREHPISAVISQIVLPSRRSLRWCSRCCSVRCGAKETSRSSQLTAVDSPSCCADPLSPPSYYGAFPRRVEVITPSRRIEQSPGERSLPSARQHPNPQRGRACALHARYEGKQLIL
jgi:hypothetical protein